jgi:hypothetical protein
MFADPEVPIGMANPFHIEIILKSKRQIQIGPADQFVEDDSVVNPLDPHFASVAIVK